MSSAQVGAMLRYLRSLTTARTEVELSDHDVLERFVRNGDEIAFATILRRHGPMVLSVCRNVLRDLHDAEDAFQATFLLLARKGVSIQRREALGGWLYRVAFHLAMRARANAARRRALDRRVVPMPSPDPVLDMSLREVRTLLFEELNGLPERYRAPLVLCGLEEKSVEEAARLLGRSRGTVKGWLQRGRAELRARLRRRGLELPAALFATGVALHSTSGQVSATLVDSTLRAAVKVAAGEAAVAAVVSAEVAALVEGASKTMFPRSIRTATILLLATSLVAVAAFGVLRQGVTAAEEPAPRQAPAEKPMAEAKPEEGASHEIRGRVLGADGKPMPGAKIYLATPTADNGTITDQGDADRDGNFRFTVPRAELENASARKRSIRVLAAAGGHGCDWAEIGLAQEELTLRLVKDVPISGQILDPDGTPVAGARVVVWAVAGVKGEDLGEYLKAVRKGEGYSLDKFWSGPIPGKSEAVTAGADGRFRLTGFGRERVVYLRVEAPNLAWSALDVMTREGEAVPNPRRESRIHAATFVYVGKPARSIRGVVRDKDTGKPVADVAVGAPSNSWFVTRTDKDGRYELRGWAKQPDYRLHVRSADGRYFHREVGLQDTPGLGPITCDLEIVHGRTVRGRVADRTTGKPIVGAKVDYHPLAGNAHPDKVFPGSWGPRTETTTDRDGIYFLGVMPGPGVIGIVAPRLEAYRPAALTLKERKDFFKTPLVEDDHEDYLRWYAGGGSYGGLGLDFYNAVVLIEPGEKEEGLVRDVSLERPEERTGRIVGPDGQAVAGVTVYGLARFGIQTLKGDEFAVRGINAKARRPLVFHHKEKRLGYYLKDLRDAPPGPLTIRLEACGSASGRVVDRDGQPVSGVSVHVMGQALRILGEEGGGYQQITTDREGRFRVEGLVPGQPYAAREFGARPSFPRFYAEVVVESGKHKDIGDLKMEEPRED